MTMNPPLAPDDDTAADRLAEDLALVLGDAPLRQQVRPRAWQGDAPLDWDAALTRAAELLRASRRPAFIGLHTLTIESLRHVVALARRHRGLLLPRPSFDTPLRLSQPVTQSATLGHLMACPWLIGVGVMPDAMPARLGLHRPSFDALPATLQTVLALRQAIADGAADHPFALRLARHGRAGVVLAHDCDPRVVSQWHHLAASVQQRSRVAVVQLPHPEALNARGVQAVVAWQTACHLAMGGVSLADADALPCLGWQAALDDPAVDLVVDTSLHALPALPGRSVIRLGSTPSPHATLSFTLPDLGAGIAGHVMRFDGQMLPLAPDPDHALPDLTCDALASLLALAAPPPATEATP